MKEVKGLSLQNCKIVMKATEDDIRYGKISCVLGLEELILLKYHTTESNLQIQCNPYQNTNGIFHGTITNNFKICMETQNTLNSLNNLEKEEHS